MEKRCDERVYNRIGMDFHGHICGRPIWKDGKCKIHHPESVAERDRKSEERYKEKNKIRSDNSAVIAELERQIHTMSIACRQDAIKLDALREENERLRKALLYIAYEHVLATTGMAENHFRQIAREALAISKMETTTMGDEK